MPTLVPWRGGTNQWIVLSSKDDDAGRRRNLAKPGLNFQAAHLRHTNINQGNRRAMNPRILQKFVGIAKRFCFQPSRGEQPPQPFQHGRIIVE